MSDPRPQRRVWRPGGRNALRAVAGAAIWLALVAGCGYALHRWQRASDTDGSGAGPRQLLGMLLDHGRDTGCEIDLDFVVPRFTRVGDPIFLADTPGRFDQVGVIVAVSDADGPVTGARARAGVAATAGRALLYPVALPIDGDVHLVHYRGDDSLAWVARTLLPPAKRARIREEVRVALDRHGLAIRDSMLPIVKDSMAAAVREVEKELPQVIAAHRGQLQTLGDEYEAELLRAEILPLVQARVAPVAEREAGPLLRSIGREIWERVSLWRIGSRWIWDQLPLTDGDSLESEWSRLVIEEALPVLERRSEEIIAMLRTIAAEVAADPAIRAALRRAIGTLADDERLHQLVWSMFRAAVVDNRGLQRAVQEHWQSPRAQAAIDDASARLEPALARIGDTILGTRADGISPEFAQVLRNRILLKDRQWLVLERSAADGAAPERLRVHPGDSPPPTDQDPFRPEGGR